MTVQIGGARECGCAGGGGYGCGCGGQRTSPVDGAFTRPRFFAGQLLTEQDLEALGAYVVAKNRLHNRYLVGSGVVCGLEVGRVAETGDRVRVRAGYALDCCGNDIVVTADQTVAVGALIADLPHAGGCVEPCPAEKDEESGSSLARRYDLVVEYAEAEAGLVAPFAGGDENGGACEPSRIREGYRFALRCPHHRKHRRPALLDALAGCEATDEEGGELSRRVRAATGLASELATAARRQPGGAPSGKELRDAAAEFDAGPTLERAVDLASLGARFALAGDAEKARTTLDRVEAAIPGLADPGPFGGARTAALREQVSSLRQRLPEPPPAGAPAGPPAAVPAAGAAAAAATATALRPLPGDRLLANRAPAGDELREELRATVARARDLVLSRSARQPRAGFRADARLARLTVDRGDDDALRDAAATVAEAFDRLARDCACAAVNPPCPSCTDTAVTLAEVVVEGSDVVEVCGSVRHYALTGAALGYWLPADRLYAEIAAACCGDGPGPTLSMLGDVRAELARRTPVSPPVPPPPVPSPGTTSPGTTSPGTTSPGTAPPAAPISSMEQRLTMIAGEVSGLQAKVRELEQALASVGKR